MYNISEIEKWVESQYMKNNKTIDMPLNALIEDATRAVLFATKYWTPAKEMPGLAQAGLGLSRDDIAQIESLKDMLLRIDEKYSSHLKKDIDKQRLFKRAKRLLNDFSSLLEWYTASTEQDTGENSVARIQDEHTEIDWDSPDELAHMLYDFASLSKDILSEHGDIGGLSVGAADDAFSVVSRLVDSSNQPVPVSPETKKRKTLKQRLAVLLLQKIDRIRKAAYFVFRDHPVIVKEVSSNYTLKTQAAAYRAEKVNQAFYRRRKQNVPLRFLPKV